MFNFNLNKVIISVILVVNENIFIFQNTEGTSQLRIKVLGGLSLAKKDIFGARWILKLNKDCLLFSTNCFFFCSDPYVRIDLNTVNGDINIDSVLTKTKKKVKSVLWSSRVYVNSLTNYCRH